jgi:hypothetical protein
MIIAMAEEPMSEVPSATRLSPEIGEQDDGLMAFWT